LAVRNKEKTHFIGKEIQWKKRKKMRKGKRNDNKRKRIAITMLRHESHLDKS